MKKFSLASSTTTLTKGLKQMGTYARHPYGIAIIGSVAVHAVAAIALPSLSEGEQTTTVAPQEIVRMVDLPPEVQGRLPDGRPPIDLSVFASNPDFNIDLSAVNQFGTGGGSSVDGNFTPIAGINNLPVPNTPNFGQTNFSFAPNPPAIASSFTGFSPPPPSVVNSFLPEPPPTFSTTTGTSTTSGTNSTVFGENTLSNPNFVSQDGNQQVFAVNPEQPRLSLLERQRQLEEDAAIALAPSLLPSPTDPDINFSAELLRPSDLNSARNPTALLPRAQTSPSQTNNNVATNTTVTRSVRGNYPQGACSSQASGTASYNVFVTPSGVPGQWSLNRSSGFNVLDNQASRDIRNLRFEGDTRNYLVNVSYGYQASFCAAFQQPTSEPIPPSNATQNSSDNIDTPVPTPAPTEETTPILTIEPTPETPSNQEEPVLTTEPEAAPEPVEIQTPAPAPESIAEPIPEPTPTPEPVAAPTPAPEPTPEPSINIPSEPLRVNSETAPAPTEESSE